MSKDKKFCPTCGSSRREFRRCINHKFQHSAATMLEYARKRNLSHTDVKCNECGDPWHDWREQPAPGEPSACPTCGSAVKWIPNHLDVVTEGGLANGIAKVACVDKWHVPSQTEGGEPSLNELLESARKHVMTPEEKEEQRQSWVRGEMALSEQERGMTSVVPPAAEGDEPSRCPTCGSTKKELRLRLHGLNEDLGECQDLWHSAQTEGGEKQQPYRGRNGVDWDAELAYIKEIDAKAKAKPEPSSPPAQASTRHSAPCSYGLGLGQPCTCGGIPEPSAQAGGARELAEKMVFHRYYDDEGVDKICIISHLGYGGYLAFDTIMECDEIEGVRKLITAALEAYADQKVRENDALNYPRIAELEKSEAALEAEVAQLRQERDALLKQKGEAWASMRKSAMSDLSIVARAERAEGALLHALECMDRNCKQCNDLLAALKSSQKSKGESQ